MNLNAWIRQTHRWVSIAFVAVVAGFEEDAYVPAD